jgi:hypothetical protein
LYKNVLIVIPTNCYVKTASTRQDSHTWE